MQILDLDGLRYRPFDYSSDTQQACTLFQTVFGHSVTSDHWHWKYQQGPGRGFAVAVEDLSSARLVGHMGVILLPGVQGGQPLNMGQVCDVMIHPAYRAGLANNNIYARMNQALQRLIAAQQPIYLFGFPGRTPANLGIRIGVYRRLGICHASHVAQSKERTWWRKWLPGTVHAQACTQLDDAAMHSLERIWSQSLCAPPPAPEDSWHTRPHIVKNAAYVRWRYFSQPQPANQSYMLWWLSKGYRNVAQGWLVTKLKPEPTIVDGCLPVGQTWIDASVQALPKPSALGGSGNWVTWLPLSTNRAEPTPIHAVEFLGQPWRTHWASPQFQPGDTDVF